MLVTMAILTLFKPFYPLPGPLMLLSLGHLPDNGALVCASTGGYSFPGSTPLHLAGRGGSVDCIRELLAWGADRHQRDSLGRIPYTVALNYKHRACAALLNPSSAEPLVWPSPLKFISELNQEAKALLEQPLIEANGERERNILKGTSYSVPSPSHSDAEIDDTTSEGHICLFSGWMREFYGPGFLELLAPQLLSRKVYL
ncbi:hypothetical protein POM88_040135 [Heracleum sosnowskyi]|uniref:Uncharacterized protein n=1 Tax=Heracleum sosnowskyi TaxID=360622 RepID=A0AAD8HDY6_9APIA|nr:hypothetical protein POM88_040135 [Heracleum sosnowskyi]